MHPIEGLFASISLADEIVLRTRPAPGVVLRSEFEFDCEPEENLCLQAARLFLQAMADQGHQDASGLSGLDIDLVKQIPMLAGLGGGSADAAAVLLGLNELADHALSHEDLVRLATRVGSDVPFCLKGGLAQVSGTGEQVQPLPFPDKPLHLLVVKPPCDVSSRWAYRAFDESPQPRILSSLEPIRQAVAAGDPRAVAGLIHNSFQSVVETCYPAIRVAREKLLWTGALGAGMSGSGAAVYGIFSDAGHCQDGWDRLAGQYPAWPCTLRSRGVEVDSEAVD